MPLRRDPMPASPTARPPPQWPPHQSGPAQSASSLRGVWAGGLSCRRSALAGAPPLQLCPYETKKYACPGAAPEPSWLAAALVGSSAAVFGGSRISCGGLAVPAGMSMARPASTKTCPDALAAATPKYPLMTQASCDLLRTSKSWVMVPAAPLDIAVATSRLEVWQLAVDSETSANPTTSE